MKKKITQLRWLATMLMLVAAMVMPSTAWAQESTVTFTAQEGTAGFSDNESFDKLIDGKFTSDDFTKWCLSFTSEGAYIIFSASEAIQVTGYSIVTGNDNANEKERNPKSWALYGCNDESAGRDSENWVLIDQKNEDTVLQDENYLKSAIFFSRVRFSPLLWRFRQTLSLDAFDMTYMYIPSPYPVRPRGIDRSSHEECWPIRVPK